MFQPWPSIKAQVLAYFVTECTIPNEKLAVVITDNLVEGDLENQWELHMDGSSNINGMGAGLTLASPEGDDLQYVLRFGFFSSVMRPNMKL